MKLSELWVNVKDRMKYLYKSSNSTISNYDNVITKFIDYIGDKDVNDITTEDILNFLTYYGSKLENSTLRLYYHALKSVLTIAGKADIDWKSVKINPENKEYNILKIEDVHKIIETAYSINPKYGIMLQLAYEGALRINELLNLKVEDFDPKECTIKVRAEKRGYVSVIPISDDLCINLKEYLRKEKPKTYLFETKYGNKWSASTFYEDVFYRVTDLAGIKVKFHEFSRHSRATHLLQQGVDLYTVNRLLRHRLLTTTAIYLHYTAKDLREKLKEAGNYENRSNNNENTAV